LFAQANLGPVAIGVANMKPHRASVSLPNGGPDAIVLHADHPHGQHGAMPSII
jgi:hypothetical protein